MNAFLLRGRDLHHAPDWNVRKRRRTSGARVGTGANYSDSHTGSGGFECSFTRPGNRLRTFNSLSTGRHTMFANHSNARSKERRHPV